MEEKKSVLKFKQKYKLKKITTSELYNIIEQQGYTVIPYNCACNDENVKVLIVALQLEEYIHSCKCFTYQDEKYRLVFINEDLSEEEKLVVLAHEEGHIWHNHLRGDSVFGVDVIQEYQANEFAHYLLVDKDGNKRKTRMFIVFFILFALSVFCGIYFSKAKHDQKVYTENYFRTNSGTKYHIEGCIYIKNKTGIQRLTKEEFESGEYEPCAVCIPFED